MTETARPRAGAAQRALSKVPAVTVWFWTIKILCTTVGESLADWVNGTLGVGLQATALIFTVLLAAVMAWQLRLNRYVALAYWLSVLVFSVTGTLYTDILTDALGVPLAVSTGVFALALVAVFGVWFARERTLSIHSITSLPRELFYWLAVLVTFALGTAAGDYTLQATGWAPGVSVLLPAGLIAAIAIGWRMGADPVLSFWLAFILTRPLGANLGDWLASPRAGHGLGLGTATTSAIFLVAIVATVAYLTATRADVMERHDRDQPAVGKTTRPRQRILLGYYVTVIAAAATLVVWSAEQAAPPAPAGAATPGGLTAHFPPDEVAKFRALVRATLDGVRTGDEGGAKARITDLERAWDDDEAALRPMDPAAWKTIDAQIDAALKEVRTRHPDQAAQTRSLDALTATLG